MQIRHLIDGKPVGSKDYFPTVNPATQEVLAEVARGGPLEVDAAVAAALVVALVALRARAPATPTISATAALAARGRSGPEPTVEVGDPAQLTAHVGKTGYLQLGFAHGGVMFLYETATAWYDTFQELMESVGDLGQIIVDDSDDD